MTKFYRKNYTFFLIKIVFFFLIAYNVNASSIDADDFVTLGSDNAPVQIKIYSSWCVSTTPYLCHDPNLSGHTIRTQRYPGGIMIVINCL